MISLGGGMPNPSTFPFKSIKVELEDGSTFSIQDSKIQEALQYSATNGLPSLMSHLDTLMKAFHNESGSFETVPRSSMVSTGSQDALSKVWCLLVMYTLWNIVCWCILNTPVLFSSNKYFLNCYSFFFFFFFKYML